MMLFSSSVWHGKPWTLIVLLSSEQAKMKAVVTCHSLPVKGLCLMPARIRSDGGGGAVRTLKRDPTDDMLCVQNVSATICSCLKSAWDRV